MSTSISSNQTAHSLVPLYKGSVKDLIGPARVASTQAVIFDYTDAYSVFDWGRMPDPLPKKGQALAVLAADWFEKLERSDSWKEFSRSPAAHAIRKANRFGSAFIEAGEELQAKGLRTHYLGVLDQPPPSPELRPVPLSQVTAPLAREVKRMVVRQVSAVKPKPVTILGRSIPDYHETRRSPAPRLVPLEVIFRYSCPEGSSLIERAERDPGYMASIGFGDYRVEAGQKWEFPVLELFTKLEPADRPLTISEALAISGLSGPQLQSLLLKTAWVSAFVRSLCAKAGLELADGKLEWGVDESGEIFLVDAIGPDELRILKDGMQLSKEFLRKFYRDSSWYKAVNAAKAQAKMQGVADWKRLVGEMPPHLSPAFKELGSQLYLALANELTGRKWFAEAWTLEEVLRKMKEMSAA